MVWVVALLATVALYFVQRSPWGRVLRAIREDEDAVRALGKNTLAYKLQSLAVSAMLAAIAGIFLALDLAFIHPTEFDPVFTFIGYGVLVLGGLANYWGVAIGAILMWTILEGSRFIDLPISAEREGAAAIHHRGADPDRVDGIPPAGPLREARGDGPWRMNNQRRLRRRTLPKAGPILEVDEVVKSFGGIHAVDGASFDLAEGSITALIGPNGAGKTTLFNVITGFYRAERGSVRFDGQPIFGRPPYAIARRGMVRTFQITKALARMPVIDNMMLAAPNQPGEKLRNVIFRLPATRRREREVRKQAEELLEVFNLQDLADEYAGTLSGGQRKLLELARALMTEPRALLLDEPMAGINPTLGRRLLDHMQRLRAERGVTFLFIEHDMDVVMGHSDRVIVMADGRVIASGPPDEVRKDPRVIDAYLGSGPEHNGADAR